MKCLASIGIKEPNGSIKAIKSGWNGNPYFDGQILINCWNVETSVRVLIGMGDLVSLGPNLNETVSKTRDLEVSWAYSAPQIFENERTWIRRMRLQGCKCFYLFSNNSWLIVDKHGKRHSDLDEYIV